MKWYFVKTPTWLKHTWTSLTWSSHTHCPTTGQPLLYLTFDDGPQPEVTSWVVKLLAEYHAKATFFCIGKNAAAHPEWLDRLMAEGHSIGNHTYTHYNAWKTDTPTYLQDAARGAAVLPKPTRLFRPPYGKITPRQAQKLLNNPQLIGCQAEDMPKIIMWDVVSADFDTTLTNEQVWQNVLQHSQPGSIVVFHDADFAFSFLKYVLPKTLKHFALAGYKFVAL